MQWKIKGWVATQETPGRWTIWKEEGGILTQPTYYASRTLHAALQRRLRLEVSALRKEEERVRRKREKAEDLLVRLANGEVYFSTTNKNE